MRKKSILFSLFFMLISSIILFRIIYPIYVAEEIIIPYGIHPFDICSKNPDLWKLIKTTYIFISMFSNFLIGNFLYTRILLKLFSIIKNLRSKFNNSKNDVSLNSYPKNLKNAPNLLQLKIGQTEDLKSTVYIPESGLFQNFLIIGTIGSGKTSSAMYPFTRQLLQFNSKNPNKKIGMLILDVKGNYYKQVQNYANNFGLAKDLIVLELHSKVFYNPLHKPHLKAKVLANRLKTILLLFSENNSESYWLDKAEDILCECIKLCRLYNKGYVTFLEIHKLVTEPDYYKEKIKILRDLFILGKLSHKQIYELNASLNFFEKEFLNLDNRTKGILISEITRITGTFVSDYDVMNTFCSPKNKLTFTGFDEVLSLGKIVVLNMNIFEYTNLSKIIAAYLKLDFQAEVMAHLAKNNVNTSAFICDEYDKFATKTDSEFFSLSREAKCINIVSTQSYSSLKTTLHDEATVKVIVQNLINKIWFRTDDIFTIEEAQKQLGKEDKEKISTSISESARETNFSYITNTLNSQNSNISETYSTYLQNDFIYDSNFFTQNLETFTALTFLSDGNKIFTPQKLKMFPHFKEKYGL